MAKNDIHLRGPIARAYTVCGYELNNIKAYTDYRAKTTCKTCLRESKLCGSCGKMCVLITMGDSTEKNKERAWLHFNARCKYGCGP